MTQNNPENQTTPADFFAEDLPPSNLDTMARYRVTDYKPEVVDTGYDTLTSSTVKDTVAEKEDNPFLRLMVIGGAVALVLMFVWTIFAILSPKAPVEIAKETELESSDSIEEDYQAKLALRDQFHSLENNKPEPEVKLEAVASPAPVPQPVPAPAPAPRVQPRPQPRPQPRVQPSFQSRPQPAPQPIAKPKPVDPNQQWQAQANFGSGTSALPVASNPNSLVATRRNVIDSVQPQSQSPSLSQSLQPLLASNTVSSAQWGIMNRRQYSSFPQPAPVVSIAPGLVKGKIEFPLVWNSSFAPDQQQSNQITVITEEPIQDMSGQVLFEAGAIAIVQIDFIDDSNGLVSARVVQIDDTPIDSQQMILRDKKKLALVAKNSSSSDFGNNLLVGGVDTLSTFGKQILIPESISTISNSSTTITNQTRNSMGRDIAGSALDGFGGSLSNELGQRQSRNRIGSGGSIYTLNEGTTIYLTNLRPIPVQIPANFQ